MQKIILLDRKEKKVQQEAASWLSKLGKDLGKVRKPKSLRHILESTLLILDEAYKQLVAVEGGLKKVPGIGDKTVPAIHSSYNSFRNAIRRVIREMVRKDILTDGRREKTGQSVAEVWNQSDEQSIRALLDEAVGKGNWPEDMLGLDAYQVEKKWPKVWIEFDRVVSKYYADEGTEKTAKVRLYSRKFAEREKTAQIMSEVNKLDNALDNVDTEIDNVGNAIQELDPETKPDEVKEVTKLFGEVEREYDKFANTFKRLQESAKKNF